jgi:hypothetical protein
MGFLPARSDRVCTLVTHGGCAATGKDENGAQHDHQCQHPAGLFSTQATRGATSAVAKNR